MRRTRLADEAASFSSTRAGVVVTDNCVMSIDIDWKNLTTGPDGLALAETIRGFIHDKFQQVELPRFIRSVQVHSIEFGKEAPSVELKDVCDPLPDFYEDDDEDGSEEEGGGGGHEGGKQIDDKTEYEMMTGVSYAHPEASLRQRREAGGNTHALTQGSMTPRFKIPSFIDVRPPSLRSTTSLADHFASSLHSRSSTPGIPGGTSNMGYFHLPLSAGLSGSQTPLAAVAGGNPYSAGWHDYHPSPWEHHARRTSPERQQPRDHCVESPLHRDPSTRPSTSNSYAHSPPGTDKHASVDGTAKIPDSNAGHHIPNSIDTQIVLHVAYSGSVRLCLSAEILLDYPMSSFVGIPLKLSITGLSFDGIALIAYLQKKAHFCFLGPEDAQALVGDLSSCPENTEQEAKTGRANVQSDGSRSLLREIRVESEIGQKESGKQVLKNVGKVEKFVLEQVRRIFEEEFVYPSFWTFLI